MLDWSFVCLDRIRVMLGWLLVMLVFFFIRWDRNLIILDSSCVFRDRI